MSEQKKKDLESLINTMKQLGATVVHDQNTNVLTITLANDNSFACAIAELHAIAVQMLNALRRSN